MKMLKKVLGAALTALMIISVFSGCHKRNLPGTTPTPVVTVPVVTPTPNHMLDGIIDETPTIMPESPTVHPQTPTPHASPEITAEG